MKLDVTMDSFKDCGMMDMKKAEFTFSGRAVDIYFHPDYGFWPIIRGGISGQDIELSEFRTLKGAKAAILANLLARN